MQNLTSQAQQKIQELAQRYGVSTDAVYTLLESVNRGGGTMAQFNHPDLGGSGQWMQGGMTMVGDMFNNQLKGTVDGLCNELSNYLANNNPYPQSNQQQRQGGGMQQQQGGGMGTSMSFSGGGNWWPSELGQPNSSGGQNNTRYAYFSGPCRLAIEANGQVTVYNTLDHQIGGVSQQQGGGSTLTFTSQYGTVRVDDLPVVSGNPPPQQQQQNPPQQQQNPPQQQGNNPPPALQAEPTKEDDILATIERLADLQQKGIISQEEFNSKKAELLSRL